MIYDDKEEGCGPRSGDIKYVVVFVFILVFLRGCFKLLFS